MMPFALLATAALADLFSGLSRPRYEEAKYGAAFALKGKKRWKKLRAAGVQMRKRP